MTAALLHDVVDDTRVDLEEVEALFGAHVAGLVATVTQLSQMNQLMRRKHREAARRAGAPDHSQVSSPPLQRCTAKSFILHLIICCSFAAGAHRAGTVIWVHTVSTMSLQRCAACHHDSNTTTLWLRAGHLSLVSHQYVLTSFGVLYQPERMTHGRWFRQRLEPTGSRACRRQGGGKRTSCAT